MRRPWDRLREIRSFRGAAMASTIGLTLVIASALGLGAGMWLDRRFRTETPWFTVAGFLVGVVAGFIEMFRIVSDISKEE